MIFGDPALFLLLAVVLLVSVTLIAAGA